jgi:hypothetical protein
VRNKNVIAKSFDFRELKFAFKEDKVTMFINYSFCTAFDLKHFEVR